MKTETVQEFLARGGKINNLDANDSTKKRIDKLKRLHTRLLKNKQTEEAQKVQATIDKYIKARG